MQLTTNNTEEILIRLYDAGNTCTWPVVQNLISLTLSLSPEFVNYTVYIDFKSKNTELFFVEKRILTFFQQKITVYL